MAPLSRKSKAARTLTAWNIPSSAMPTDRDSPETAIRSIPTSSTSIASAKYLSPPDMNRLKRKSSSSAPEPIHDMLAPSVSSDCGSTVKKKERNSNMVDFQARVQSGESLVDMEDDMKTWIESGPLWLQAVFEKFGGPNPKAKRTCHGVYVASDAEEGECVMRDAETGEYKTVMSDVIDLRTMRVVVDNDHLSNLADDVWGTHDLYDSFREGGFPDELRFQADDREDEQLSADDTEEELQVEVGQNDEEGWATETDDEDELGDTSAAGQTTPVMLGEKPALDNVIHVARLKSLVQSEPVAWMQMIKRNNDAFTPSAIERLQQSSERNILIATSNSNTRVSNSNNRVSNSNNRVLNSNNRVSNSYNRNSNNRTEFTSHNYNASIHFHVQPAVTSTSTVPSTTAANKDMARALQPSDYSNITPSTAKPRAINDAARPYNAAEVCDLLASLKDSFKPVKEKKYERKDWRGSGGTDHIFTYRSGTDPQRFLAKLDAMLESLRDKENTVYAKALLVFQKRTEEHSEYICFVSRIDGEHWRLTMKQIALSGCEVSRIWNNAKFLQLVDGRWHELKDAHECAGYRLIRDAI